MKSGLLFGLLFLALSVVLISWYTVVSHKVKVGLVYSEDLEETMDLAIEAVKKYEGKLSFSIVRKPVGFEKEEIEHAIEDLHRKRVRLIVGPTYSTQAKFMLPLLERYRILALSPTVTSPAVLGVSKYLVSISLSDNVQARELAKAAMEVGGNVMMVLDEHNYVYTKTFAAIFTSEYRGGDVHVTTVDQKPPQNTCEMARQMKAHVLVLVCNFDQASQVVKLILDSGADCQRILGSDMVSYGIYDIEKHPWMKKVETFVHYDVESERSFLKAHPTFASLFEGKSMTFINTIDALLLMDKLVRSWGDDPEKIVENLPKVSYNGIGGTIRFDPKLQVQRKASLVYLGR